MKNIFISALFLLFMIPSAHAQDADAGLYDPLPDEDAAFIRFINTSAAAQKPEITALSLPSLPARAVSSYYVLGKASVQLKSGAAEQSFTPEAGKYYTVIAGHILTIVQDGKENDRSKALIQFYNLGEEDALSLKTADGKVEIVGPIAINTTGSRAVNAVKLEAAVYSGSTKIKDLPPTSLERGLAYTAVIFPDHEVLWTQSTVDTAR